jgi:hypothetical protein
MPNLHLSTKLSQHQTPRAMETGWGVEFKDGFGKVLGFVALTNNGRCAFVRGRLYPVDVTLVTFLNRYFSFLSYPPS